MTTIDTPVSGTDETLTRRGLRHALDKTTDLAERELRVPLHYYRDPKITEIEESQILRRVPLAIVPSAQVPNENDYVVRSVLGDSLLVTRDRFGTSHVLLNYCRHRGAMPACGSGNASRFVCPYHAWTYRNTGELFSVPGKAGFDSMATKDYGLVELPSEERHGFIWAVLIAGATIDLDAHLGDFVPNWRCGTTSPTATTRSANSRPRCRGRAPWRLSPRGTTSRTCTARASSGRTPWPTRWFTTSSASITASGFLSPGSPTPKQTPRLRSTPRRTWG